MLRAQGIVHLTLQCDIRRSLRGKICWSRRFHRRDHTFSRSGIGLKMRFQPDSKLKRDIFKTSIGSCRRRSKNGHQFRRLFVLSWIGSLMFIVWSLFEVSGQR